MERILKINKALKHIFIGEDSPDEVFERFDESLTPNLRALRLTMGIADTLLSMGVAASDVVDMCLSVTSRYCKRTVQIEIISNLTMLSQDRGNDREPLTLIRAVPLRSTNDRQIQNVQELIREISEGGIDLDDAEKKFDHIISHPDKFPLWLTTAGSASISAGVGLMLSASPFIIAVMFVSGGIIALFMRIISRRKISSFFVQMFSAMLITLIAGGVAFIARTTDIQLFDNVNPSYIVIGGIIMLLAGLAFVAAIQDAIDEYYVTANARLLKVTMLTAGIVAGVVIGMYFARQFGVWINLTLPSFSFTNPLLQFSGAIAIAAGYAVSTHSRPVGILLAACVGFATYSVYISLTMAGLTPIAASGVAAMVAGASGTLLSRLLRVPSIALSTAGIIPLVPGLTLFNGLMSIFAETTTVTAVAPSGSDGIMTALFIALAIGGGVSLGTWISRPLRRTLNRARNALPRHKLYSNRY